MSTRQAAILGAILFGLAQFSGEATDLGLRYEEICWAETTIEVRFGGDLEAVRLELEAAAGRADALCALAERAS